MLQILCQQHSYLILPVIKHPQKKAKPGFLLIWTPFFKPKYLSALEVSLSMSSLFLFSAMFARITICDYVSVKWCFVCGLIGDKQKETLRSRLWKWLYERFGVYIEDFRFQPEENTVETEEPLSAKR